MRSFLFLLFGVLSPFTVIQGQEAIIFKLKKGEVSFTSDAPLELIEAKSTNFQGVIDPQKRTFAFSIPIASFEGFNSPLQREHFNENYMESGEHIAATFLGKIIEPVDLSQDGDYTIRAKGKLSIHGVEHERIIKSSVQVTDGNLYINSFFTVLLKDHNIEIPRIVFQKIAEKIKIELRAQLEVKAL